MHVTVACAFDSDGLASFDREAPPAVDILILPELFDGGYRRLADTGGRARSNGALAARCTAISRRHKLHLIAGTLALPDGTGGTGNISLVISNGKQVGRFAKTHLFRPLGDDRYFAPGRPHPLVALTCGSITLRCGVIVCYDLRFPEIVRPWFKEGLDLLVVPARWPRARDETWRVLLQARAIENQCFVVGVNARDAEGGGSYAFGPAGEPLFALGPDPTPGEPTWRLFDFDTDLARKVKARLDTRPDAILL